MITAIVLTYNSGHTIRRCLESLTWTDQILVIDSGSGDDTIRICESFGARVHKRDYRNYGDQLNFALTLVKTDWALVVDSDEYLSPGLIESIRNTIASSSNPVYNGYKLARMSYFLDKPIHHGGWYPDYVLRLFLRAKTCYKDRELGSSAMVEGPTGHLEGDLVHHPYKNMDEYFSKFHRYADAWAREMYKKGKRCRFYHLFLWPPARFLKMYLLRAGFLDGMPGFLLSGLTAFYVWTKYLKLYELQRSD